MQLQGKRALVTGGSRGLGFAIASELCDEGARVALLARDAETVERAASTLRSRGYDAIAVSADTSRDDEVDAAVAKVTEDLGGVDILVNAAAKAAGGPPTGFQDLDDDALRTEMETKVLGYLRCARAVAPQMIDRGWGRVINISGLNLRRTGSMFGAIRNVSVVAMSKNLADELGPHGVNVTVVHPGLTLTDGVHEMIRAGASDRGITEPEMAKNLAQDVITGRLVEPVEVAHVVTFLCSPLSVAITGDAVAVGGGQLGSIHY
nr:SDR family NAD(P)-dependent oxidoreductase [Allobranchiibius huperziae]